jgi:hypothetical protein
VDEVPGLEVVGGVGWRRTQGGLAVYDSWDGWMEGAQEKKRAVWLKDASGKADT